MEDEKVEMSLKERIVHIMNELRITKTGKNTFSNYEYFKPETINQVVNPLLLKYKVFPHFTTHKEQRVLESKESLNEPVINYKYEYEEVATLTLSDMYGKEPEIIYSMSLADIDLKGANAMQKKGGIRTYAKRYLYMEALNISDDNLDLDSDAMSDKKNKKPSANSTKVEEMIQKIRAKVSAMREAGATEKELCEAIKSVHKDGGEPSANYTTIGTIEEGNAILKALDRI